MWHGYHDYMNNISDAENTGAAMRSRIAERLNDKEQKYPTIALAEQAGAAAVAKLKSIGSSPEEFLKMSVKNQFRIALKVNPSSDLTMTVPQMHAALEGKFDWNVKNKADPRTHVLDFLQDLMFTNPVLNLAEVATRNMEMVHRTIALRNMLKTWSQTPYFKQADMMGQRDMVYMIHHAPDLPQAGFVSMKDIPVLSAVMINGKRMGDYWAAPELSNWLKRFYMNSQPVLTGSAGDAVKVWQKATDVMRSIDLWGGFTSHYWNIFKKTMDQNGSDYFQALARFLPDHYQVDTYPKLYARAISAGLDTSAMRNNIRGAYNSLKNAMDPSMAEQLKPTNFFARFAYNVLEGVEKYSPLSADHVIFNSMVHEPMEKAMVNGYLINLTKVWAAKGPEWISQGVPAEVAFKWAEQQTVRQVNSSMGSVPLMLQSDGFRNLISGTMNTPAWFTSKIDDLMGALDSILSAEWKKFGPVSLPFTDAGYSGRRMSRFAGVNSAVFGNLRNEFQRTMWQGAIAGCLYTTMASYLVNGHNTLLNGKGNELKVRLYDDDVHNTVYLNFPAFGALQTLMHMVKDGAIDHDVKKVIGSIEANFSPMVAMMTNFIVSNSAKTGGNISDQPLQSLAKGALERYQRSQLFQIGTENQDIPGVNRPETDTEPILNALEDPKLGMWSPVKTSTSNSYNRVTTEIRLAENQERTALIQRITPLIMQAREYELKAVHYADPHYPKGTVEENASLDKAQDLINQAVQLGVVDGADVSKNQTLRGMYEDGKLRLTGKGIAKIFELMHAGGIPGYAIAHMPKRDTLVGGQDIRKIETPYDPNTKYIPGHNLHKDADNDEKLQIIKENQAEIEARTLRQKTKEERKESPFGPTYYRDKARQEKRDESDYQE